MTLSPADVLARLKLAAQSRSGFIFSVHAFSRAAQRTVTRQDVMKAFLTAGTVTQQDNGAWRVEGLDEDGDQLIVIVSVGDRVEIITVC